MNSKVNKKYSFSQAEIEFQLIAAGIQPTLQRISLFGYLLCEANHPTAEDVHTWAEKNLAKISLATVYNTLNTLVEAKLLKVLRLPHTEKMIYDANIFDHHHFIDEKTGELFDISKADLKYDLSLPGKYKVKDFDLVFRGSINELNRKHQNNLKSRQ